MFIAKPLIISNSVMVEISEERMCEILFDWCDEMGLTGDAKGDMVSNTIDIMSYNTRFTWHEIEYFYVEDPTKAKKTTIKKETIAEGIEAIVCQNCRMVLPPEIEMYSYSYCLSCGMKIEDKDE
jgi:DNA replication protein DnaD